VSSVQSEPEIPFNLGEDLAGTLKAGGKIRGKTGRGCDGVPHAVREIDRIGQASGGRYTLYREQIS